MQGNTPEEGNLEGAGNQMDFYGTYQATDDWNYVVTPYVDLVLLPPQFTANRGGKIRVGFRQAPREKAVVVVFKNSSGFRRTHWR